jgi:RHS repeat-associated protein
VTATGSSLNYQWQFNGTNISGATGSCYTPTNVLPNQAGIYAVVVSNTCGSVTSTNAILTVNVAPAITGQPANVTVCAGSGAGFCVTATGSPLNYQWQFNGTNISGATGSCYTLTNVQPGQAGSYSVVVSNSCGSVTSTNAILTVNVAPVITGQPTNVTVCAGSAAGFCVMATGSSLNYQWQFNGTNISGATGSCYTLTNVQPNQAGIYTVVVSNTCGSVTSTNAILTVNVPPVITGQPTNLTVCAGSGAGFCVTATGSSLNYQWQFNGTNISGATGSCYTLTNVQPSQAGIYAVVVSNSCGSVTSTNAILTVNVAPGITQQPVNVTTNVGGSATFTVMASGMPNPNYQWYFNSGVLLPNATNAVLTLTNVQLNQAGIYSVVVSNAAGSVNSIYAVLRVWTLSSIVGWGSDSSGEIDVPVELTNGVAIAGGANYSLALRSDGTVVGWGRNDYGQTNVPPDLTNVVAIASDIFHSLALKNDGTVVGWGRNDYGQANVPPNLTNAVAIAAGYYHSLTLKSDGTVVGWGRNDSGQADVPPNLTNVVAIAASGYHSLALKSDGTVVGWGRNDYGQGNVPPNLTNVVAIAGGAYHSLALKSDGTVVAWGDDGFGETNVPPRLTNVVAIAAGVYHSLALKSDGTVVAWGYDVFGETNVPPRLTNVVAIAAGSHHNLALDHFPPWITTQPANQTSFTGITVIFSVTATGTWPLSYQWSLNGTNIMGATNMTLTLTNIQLSQAGNYMVLVTNAYGSALSTNAILNVIQPTPCIDPPNGLVAWWRAETNALDSIGTNNGTLQEGAGFTDGMVGQAFSVDGVSSYVSIPNSPSLDAFTSTITIELWLKSDQFYSDWAGIVTKGNSSWQLQATPGANTVDFNISVSAGSLSGSRNVNDGQWHHVAAVYDGTNMFLYVDGTLDVSQPATGFIPQNNDPLCIGANAKAYVNSCNCNELGYFFNGLIDEVSIYNRALSSNEIAAIYCTRGNGKCVPPPAVPPVITQQPVNVTTNVGGNATFRVTATGTLPLSYQWWFNGTNALGGATNISLTLANVQTTNAGNYSVVVMNVAGSAISSNAVLSVYSPLSVQFVTPTNGQLFVTSPLNILLTAATSDSSGTVTNVQFFNGTSLLGNVTVASSNTWTLLWTNVVAGNYSLTAIASDNAGNMATNGISIIVNAMPVVSIITPTNFQPCLQSSNITLSASASDSDGFIAQVQFYYFTNLWGTVTSTGANGYYNFTTNNLPPGFYPITATAMDNRGAVGWSDIKIFRVISTNTPPTVAITFPTNGATFAPGCDITITVTATANTNAAITNVEFFVNGESIGSDSASPYNLTRCCWGSGTYQLAAKATDNLGMSMFSTNVQIIVLGEPPTGDGFWDPYFGNTNINNHFDHVTAMTVHGTDLYIGGYGYMSTNNGPALNSLVKWDGTNWSGMGCSQLEGTGVEPNLLGMVPYAIAVDGTNIYVGGQYMGDSGTILAKCIGTNWLDLGGTNIPSQYYSPSPDGPPVTINAIAIVGSDVYVGGDFVGDADTNIQYIARLNPSDLSPEPIAGLNGPVFALATIGNKLFAGGTFTNAGGNSSANYIAEWDGNVWTNLGTGVGGLNSFGKPGAVYALAACGSNLYVGGDFTTVGGHTNANGIARWDGKQWTTLHDGLIGGGSSYNGNDHFRSYSPYKNIPSMRVLSISTRGNTLFVGGAFTRASQGTGQTLVNYIAKAEWSEQSQTWTWTDLDEGVTGENYLINNNYIVTSTAIMEGSTPGSYDLFVGGSFDRVGSAQISDYGMARWSVGRPYPAGPPSIIITNPVSMTIFTNPSCSYRTIETNEDGRISTNLVASTNIIINIVTTALSYTNIRSVNISTNGQLLFPGTTYDNVPNPSSSLTITNFWINPPCGVFLLTAVAEDQLGVDSKPSQPVLVDIKNPTNSITAVDDQYTIPEGSPAVTFYVLTNDIPANGLKISQITRIHANLGNAAVSFGGSCIRYTPFPNVYGIDTIYYTVTNSDRALDTAAVTVNILPLPQVNIKLPWDGQQFTNLTSSLVVTGWVASVNTDTNASVTNVTLYVIDANSIQSADQTPTNGTFSFNWLNRTPGFYTFVAVATDGNGYTNTSAPVTVSLHDSNAPSHIVTAVISNLDSTVSSQSTLAAEIYPIISDGYFELQGRAADSIPTNPVAYQVLLFQPDPYAGMATGDPAIEYLGDIPFANLTPGPLNGQGYHNGGDTNGDLGRLDLTGIPNGVYVIMLKVRGGDDETNALVQVQINSQLKIGQFSFTEQDLVLPVNGIPITVTRTYNSQNLHSGDFGTGWTYAMNSMDVQLDDQRKDVQIGGNSFPFSDQDGFVMPTDTSSLLPHTVSIRAGGNWDVTLTLPDGRRTTFTFTVNGVWPNFYAGWQAPPGVSAKLEMIGNNQLVCGVLGFNVPVWADSDLTFGHAPMEYHDVAGWILTTQPDGTTYYITRGTKNSVVFDSTGYGDYISAQVYDAKPKLTKIVQHSGNVIQIGDNGITNYSGTNLTRSITFDRDYAGRITAVYDPISQLSTLNSQPAVKYIYDRDNDNLLQVLKLVDRNAGTYTTNQYHYDNPYFPHFITSIENGNGVPVARNYYDDSGKLIAVQDANGNLTQFIHDTANNMEVIVDQLGYGSTNYYDSRGNVTTTVNALGQTNRFAFDSNNYLLQSVDPLGHTNSYGYDANGCRIASTNALGQATHFKFDNYGQLLSKTDALMNATSFGYDSGGHRTSVTDALGNPTTFGHDVYGRPNAVTDALSRLRATAGSDSSGNLQFVSQVGGLQMNFGHDLNGNTTNTSFVWVNPNDPNQTQTLSTITELDAANRVTRVTDPDGQSRMTIYDPAGRVAQSIDRMGNTNSYVYDAMGNTIQTTYADGSVTRNVYDARSQVLYSDDRHLPGLAANGTHNVYDPLGRVIRTERLANVQIDVASSGTTGQSAFNSAGAVLSASSTAYDAAGRVLAATNALGYVTRYEYDAVGRQTAVVDALTNRTDSVYDAAGQLQFTTNALKQVTEYQYDAKGRRIKTIFPDNSYTTNSYNEIGQLMFVKDQAGLETDYQYDSLGRMTNISKPPVFNPEGGTNANPQWEYQYDSYGNILDIRDPKGRETKFTYDAFGQLISRTLPLLQTNFNAYNALGQLAMAVDFLGQSNRFVYDSLGRVATNFLYAAGATAPSRTNIFIYDANGRLYQTLRPEGITTFQYNLDGAVTNITSPEGAISYEYDPTMGSLARVYTLNSDIRYSYDELSRLKTVSVVKRDGATLAVPEVTTNTYTRLGSLQDMFYPNGVHAAYQYDMMNRLTNLTCTSSASVLLSQYQYVPNANSWRLAATEVLRQVNGTYVTNQLAWGYDNLGRLTNEASSSTLAALNYTNKYVYDLAGNRLWKTNVVGAVTTITSYSYNANDQLLVESTGSIIFTNRYDANGSLTNRSSASEVNVYSYNLEGRLATAAINQQQTNKYYYNQSGIRTRMDIFGSVSSTNIFLNDPQNLTGFSQVLEELPRVGAAPTATYTLGSQIISQEKSGTTLHLMADGHGSTRLLTDSSGAVQNAFTYDGYGSLIASNAAPQTAYLYSGERFDSDLRQYYLRARYYNPAVGRFGAMDQVDGTPNDPLSLHKYAYTQNNPVNMRDPSGNESLMSLTISMSIGVSMQLLYNSPTLYHGYIAAKQVTELGASRESILDAASRNASPDVTTATIIVHGVAGHPNGWSQDLATTPFQQNLSNPVGKTPKKGVENDPLNHDFYEFDWGGFSIVNAPPFLIPIKSVHEMALVHLQMAEFLVWMNGYGNIDIISHSWGTTLSYDLMNSTDIEVHDWVTMGSPLKQTTEKPVENTGNWINCYDLNDPVVHLEMYPPFPNICGLPLPSSLIGAGLTAKQGIIQLPYDFGFGLFSHPFVHSDYWNSQEVLSDLRKWLQ